jgi:hypothetical protein
VPTAPVVGGGPLEMVGFSLTVRVKLWFASGANVFVAVIVIG